MPPTTYQTYSVTQWVLFEMGLLFCLKYKKLQDKSDFEKAIIVIYVPRALVRYLCHMRVSSLQRPKAFGPKFCKSPEGYEHLLMHVGNVLFFTSNT